MQKPIRVTKRWTRKMELVALALYLSDADDVEIVISLVENNMHDMFNSTKMKIANYRYLDTGIGLSNYTKLSEKVFYQYIG